MIVNKMKLTNYTLGGNNSILSTKAAFHYCNASKLSILLKVLHGMECLFSNYIYFIPFFFSVVVAIFVVYFSSSWT